jgi:hypothetical protein
MIFIICGFTREFERGKLLHVSLHNNKYITKAWVDNNNLFEATYLMMVDDC